MGMTAGALVKFIKENGSIHMSTNISKIELDTETNSFKVALDVPADQKPGVTGTDTPQKVQTPVTGTTGTTEAKK